MQQLSLFEPTGSASIAGSAEVLNTTSRNVKPHRRRGNHFKHGIVRNATQRGCYYAYWYNYLLRDEEGNERVVTRKAVIRGAAVGTDRGEQLRRVVESWIERGETSESILRLLKRLPKSTRRCRYPNWENVMGREEDMRVGEWS